MGEDFLSALLGNRARTKLVRVFVFNQSERAEPLTVVQLAKRSGVSAQLVGREAREMEKMGIIKRRNIEKPSQAGKSAKPKKGRLAGKKETAWEIDTGFKHLRALSSFVHEVSPIRYENVVSALKNTGKLGAVVVSGCFMGDATRPVDIIIVADNLNEARLLHAVQSLESSFGREIRYASFSPVEFSYRLTIQDRLIRDILDYPHKVLLDRAHLI